MSDSGQLSEDLKTQANSEQQPSLPYRVFSWLIKQGYKWILVPVIAGILSILLISHIVQGFVGPQRYMVYFVGPFTGETFQGFEEVFTGANAATHTLNGVKVRFEKRDDHGNLTDALRIATQIAAKPDTLMVIGHILSTQTQAALPIYLQQAEPPIPVILTTETNPNLLPPQISPLHPYPVLHLSPTDEQQAEVAADFAISKGAKAFWVVEDVSNPLYAHYLAQEFIRRVQEKSKSVLLWSTTLSIPPVDAIRALKIDWVFFAGDWQSALIVIRQLKTLAPQHRMGILLTDGCADQDLLKNGGNDLEGVYLTHPLTYTSFNSQGYGIYAANALKLVQRLVEGADTHYAEYTRDRGTAATVRSLLGISRIGDARNALIKQIETVRGSRESLHLNAGELLRFEWTGERTDAKFHVWQIHGKKFHDVP